MKATGIPECVKTEEKNSNTFQRCTQKLSTIQIFFYAYFSTNILSVKNKRKESREKGLEWPFCASSVL